MNVDDTKFINALNILEENNQILKAILELLLQGNLPISSDLDFTEDMFEKLYDRYMLENSEREGQVHKPWLREIISCQDRFHEMLTKKQWNTYLELNALINSYITKEGRRMFKNGVRAAIRLFAAGCSPVAINLKDKEDT